jgi:hypothetical protein
MTYVTMEQRRDTAANWLSNNPVLGPAEIGHETDTGKSKIGDGSTAWTSLGYWNPSGDGGSFSVVTLPAPTGIASVDTAAIQDAENALSSGGGKIIFQAGTYVVTGLIKYGNVTWQGTGRLSTVIQLASGANTDVIQGYQFGSLTGTGSTAGIFGWGIRDMSVNGNGSAQTGASYGIRVYGKDFDIDNIEVTNCYSDGMYSEWGNGGSDMEARVKGKFHDNGTSGSGWGVNWQGPHDSVLSQVQAYDNPTGQINFDTHATGTWAIQCHTYGSGALGVRMAAQSIQWADSVAEASSTSLAMLILANGCEVIGGSIYDVNAGASTGVQIGDGTHTPNTVWVETFISGTGTSCVNFNNSGGHNYISPRVYQNSGSVITGTPAATDSVAIKPGSYFVAPGVVPQTGGSLLRMHLPDPGGTAGWYKVGTWQATAGARLRIVITGTGSYNADTASAGRTVITVSTGSGSPTPNIQGVWYTENGTALLDTVKCARNGSAETWDIWVHLTAGYTGNSFVTVDTGSDTFPTTFQWSLTSGSDPGVASTTVAVLTEQFQIESPAIFPGGITVPVTHPLMGLLATTDTSNPSGYSLINGTGTVLTWTAPNDGATHIVLVAATLDVASTETGGKLTVGFTMPDGTSGYTYQLSAGGQGVGYDYSLYSVPPLIVKANTSVFITQSTALTSGAAKLWAKFIGW